MPRSYLLRGFAIMILLSIVALLFIDAPREIFGTQPNPNTKEAHLSKIGVYLAAADYRRALETCQKEIDAQPSAESYLHLTYVYHAVDAYLDSLAKAERWGTVEQMYLNLAYRDPQDLLDPPGGLARMAKEMIQTSVRQQSDITAAMATRLNKPAVERLWIEQTAWRAAHPESWWSEIPAAWQKEAS